MALGSTQPLVKMSSRNIPGGKSGRCMRVTTSIPLSAECHENLGGETSWNPLGHTEPVTGLLYLLPLIQMLQYTLCNCLFCFSPHSRILNVVDTFCIVAHVTVSNSFV